MPIPTCPQDCSSELPVVSFSKCNPEVSLSEIRRIFVAKANAEPFEDWETATEWTERISETDVENDNAIRPMTVIADKPAADGVVQEISDGRNITVGKDHVINWTVDDVSNVNYEFMRIMECGSQYKIWYETFGGKLFGGNEGISVSGTANSVLNRGRDEIETIEGTFSWRSKFHPERTDSPIFDSTYSDDVVVED